VPACSTLPRSGATLVVLALVRAALARRAKWRLLAVSSLPAYRVPGLRQRLRVAVRRRGGVDRGDALLEGTHASALVTLVLEAL